MYKKCKKMVSDINDMVIQSLVSEI